MENNEQGITKPLNFEFEKVLKESLEEIYGKNYVKQILQVPQHKSIKDATSKIIVKAEKDTTIAVALFSSPSSPDMVARGVKNALLAKQILGSDAGCHILEPLCQGYIDNRSYAVNRYCTPLSNSRLLWYYQRFLLLPHLLKWLRQMAEISKTKVFDHELKDNFVAPLKYLIESKDMTEKIRTKASQSLERLENGTWKPYYILMHNDLWIGNILLDNHHLDSSTLSNLGKFLNSFWKYNFVVIDWAGSMSKGYAIYDLIRLSESLNLKQKKLRREVDFHCQILNCDLIDAYSYLLVALGYLGMHLEFFPLPRFVKLAESCLETLERIF